MIAETTAQCNELKTQSRDWAIGIVQGAHDFVISSLAGYQNVAKTSLDQINEVNKNFQAEHNNQKNVLGMNVNNQ